MAQSQRDLENIKKFIASVESIGDYNIYNFDGGSGIKSSTPSSNYFKTDAVTLTNKTLRQVLIAQSPHQGGNPLGKGNLFAVGKYQIVPSTLYTAVERLNLFDTLFDEATQEKLGDYLILDKRPESGAYIKGSNGGSKKDLEDAVQALGQEFASFPIITRGGEKRGDVETGDGNIAYYGGKGVNPTKSKYKIKNIVEKLYEARILYSGKPPSYIPSYITEITPPSSDGVTISGKVTDENGQPVEGATVKIDPPVEYPDTPFQTQTESDEFRKWLLEKYPGYKNQPPPFNVDPPPQRFTNSKALRKAWAEKGSEYDATATTASSTSTGTPQFKIVGLTGDLDKCPKECDPGFVFSTIPTDFGTFLDLMVEKSTKCKLFPQCGRVVEKLETGGKGAIKDLANWEVFLFFVDALLNGDVQSYNRKYDRYNKSLSQTLSPDDNNYIDPVNAKQEWESAQFLSNYSNEILKYYNAPWYFELSTTAPTKITQIPGASTTTTETKTDENGIFTIITTSDYSPTESTITIISEGYEPVEKSNLQQTGGDVNGKSGREYGDVNVTARKVPDPITTVTNQINQEILAEESKSIKQQGNSDLTTQETIANAANNQKEELKKTAIPFVIKLLLPFGAIALQAIVSKIPLDKIADQIQCPNQAKLLELVNKRNKLVKQINNVYKTINILTKALSITSAAITAIQAGITTVEALPYPATGIPPLGLPPLTSGVIETTGSGKDKLKESLKKANVVISVVTLALASFGAVLGIILALLNSLDTLIQQCASEQDVPFEAINNELNSFVNSSTGISNSDMIQAIQEDKTYKGFTLEIKFDTTNSSKYPKRFAQALTKQGVPVLKTDSSFASDAQVLIDQLKFIIDSNPQLTAE